MGRRISTPGIIAVYCLAACFELARAQVDRVCTHPLGMQDKRIPDDYVTATSYHAPSTGPVYARLGRDEGDGAWCPLGNVEPRSEDEYLQIQLPSATFVTRVATQGRHSEGKGREFMKSYKVKYSRNGQDWLTWSNANGVEILNGNFDTNTISVQSLNPSIAGVKYLRIVPVATTTTPVCLRVEIYGCPWNSGLVSYDIPTPVENLVVASRQAMFSDDTYDGTKAPSGFVQGLGQLADGKKGNDISQMMSRFPSNPIGYDYVGWSISQGVSYEVEMLFQFDTVRQFTLLRVYSYVDDDLDASLFSKLHIFFSENGFSFNNYPQTSFNADMEKKDVRFRSFDLPLNPTRLANAIKFKFEVPKGRLLLSEVEFENVLLPTGSRNKASTFGPEESVVIDSDVNGAGITLSPTNDNSDYTWVIVGVLVGVIALLVLIVAALCYRQRKLRKTLTPPSFLYQTTSNRDEPLVTLAPRLSPPDEPETKMPIYHEISPNVNFSDNIYHEPRDAIGHTPPPPYQPPQQSHEMAGTALPFSIHSHDGNDDTAPHYAETDIFAPKLLAQPIQGVFGNNIYAVPWSSPSPKARRKKKTKKSTTLPIHNRNNTDGERKTLLPHFHADDLPPEFPRKKLDFMEKLGEGQFGEVHLCRADPLIRTLEEDDEFILPGSPTSPVLVAVKVLRKDATQNAKEDFLKEVRVMSRLIHKNIVRLLAVCTEEEPFAIITEYMEHGDLNQYLHDFDDEMKNVPGKNVIQTESLITMAVQVAAGMEYLSSLNFVHRDLATRNCLVGSGYDIRIGDFGMSRNMYQSDYYRIQGKAVLPIRWMAWESVLLGKFSSASDVWSFGVTLWEICSLCKHQPFSALSDKQVIENMQHLSNKTGKEVHLPRPKRCPASTYNMMRQCWKRDSEYRPTFSQLHSYLLERRQTSKSSPKPKRPQVKPPVPLV